MSAGSIVRIQSARVPLSRVANHSLIRSLRCTSAERESDGQAHAHTLVACRARERCERETLPFSLFFFSFSRGARFLRSRDCDLLCGNG
ncbi:hypothetical protein CDAR_92691 [Caerostris darwini]|uniref:Uncharacterized protein n=1 Tax=Caerostris darwini TaxID=1538125 RepID=A0AAV4QC55_9ARAC|nr:hypothetical protein CDAR_92691 [Caerostris darwini]